jgi:hypothetical protein
MTTAGSFASCSTGPTPATPRTGACSSSSTTPSAGGEGRRRPGGHPRWRRPALLLGPRHGIGQGHRGAHVASDQQDRRRHPTGSREPDAPGVALLLPEHAALAEPAQDHRRPGPGHGLRRRPHAHVGLRPHRGGRERLLRRRGGHPARHVRGRVLRAPLGVRSPQGQGAHAHRRRHRRPRGPPPRHGLEDLPDRRAARQDPRVRPAHRRAPHGGGAAHQGVGEPDGRQHGLLQLAAGLLHAAPAEPLALGRGPRDKYPVRSARGRGRRLEEPPAGPGVGARRGRGTIYEAPSARTWSS